MKWKLAVGRRQKAGGSEQFNVGAESLRPATPADGAGKRSLVLVSPRPYMTGWVIGAIVVVLVGVGWIFRDRLPFVASAETPDAAEHRHGSEAETPAPTTEEGGNEHVGHNSDMAGMEGMGEDEGVVEIAPEMVQTLGVTMEAIQERALAKTIRAVGRVDVNEQSLKMATSRVGGRIERLFVGYPGAVVRKGAPLVSIYSPELVSSQREYLIALKSAKRSEGAPFEELRAQSANLVSVSKQRLAQWGLTDKQIEAIPREGVATDMTIFAPIGGTVVQKNVLEGAYVTPGTPLYTIADLSTVWVYLDLYESDLASVRTGQEIALQVPSYPERSFRGKVTFMDPFVDPQTRTVRVRAQLSNAGGLLKPGMFANASLRVSLGGATPAIPESAVIRAGERDLVILSLGNGRFRPQEVHIGALADGYYQAFHGVSPGDTVVTSANFLIDSESNLRTAVRKMAP